MKKNTKKVWNNIINILIAIVLIGTIVLPIALVLFI